MSEHNRGPEIMNQGMNQGNNDNDPPLDVLQPSAVMALEKASIDVQVATAHQYPRSIERFRRGAMAMATLDEETAADCCYCRPVGKEMDKTTGKWVDKFAEGPSIRLAEIAAVNFGNLRVASRIVEQTERYVKAEGVCHDLESNYAGKSECIEATVTKEGRPYSERQRALISKVALSKAYRDAIFKVVPRAICKPVYEQAKKVASGEGKTMAQKVEKARAWIGTLKIDESRVLSAINLSEWAKATQEHLDILTGLRTGIKDKEFDIDEAFPVLANAPAQAPGKPAAAPQQSEAPKTPPEQAKAPAKAPVQQAPAPAPAPAPTPAPVAAPAQQSPEPTPAPVAEQSAAAPTPEPTDESAAEAALGLAPSQEPDPAAPAIEAVDPSVMDQPQDKAEVKAIKALARKDGVTANQVMGWFIKNRMAKQGEALGDVDPKKLGALARLWEVPAGSASKAKLPEIRTMPK